MRKKGGRKKKAHVNRLKFYDPINSPNDPTVSITPDDDEPDEPDAQPKVSSENEEYTGRMTRSRTKNIIST